MPEPSPDQFFKDAASATPDAERALKNLRSFSEANPGYTERCIKHIRPVSLLFSISQFLANFASFRPEALFEAVDRVDTPLEKEFLRDVLRRESDSVHPGSTVALMDVVRVFRKEMFLWITLRDILGKTDIVESMSELSLLADVILEESLRIVREQTRETYGEPGDEAFSVIAVGKLGSGELNFSSDVDLIYVYGREEGETSGIMTPQGIVKNRISNHEYYCKLGEALNRSLSMNTENGFVYRVDLRLRPEGQRGPLAMSLPAYEIYYESWGRAWERAVFLRARPVAGDSRLGRDFMETIRPFVYRKYLDFDAIDEIRRMKTKIDEKFKKDDIKRGYGGIREIEFFAHALQLIYGGKEPLLQERSTLKGLHKLLQKNLVGHRDYAALSDAYRFLRKLEHRLQQLNDLQTHSLPPTESDLAALGKKMGFPDRKSFTSDLDERRRAVRRIYDSLFKERRPRRQKGDERISLIFTEELSEGELREFLDGYQIKDMGKAIRNIRLIRDSTLSFQTLRGQRLLGEILPVFLEEALRSQNPDSAINHLQSFSDILSSEESYLDLFAQNEDLIPGLVRIFSRSDYLAKNIMKRKEYLELLGHEIFPKKTLRSLISELKAIIASGRSVAESIRVFKQMEEIRTGILFLNRVIDTFGLVKELSKTADAIVSAGLEEAEGADELTVIAFGKAGGRELTFGSDLDLIFVCDREVAERDVKAAERLIRLMISYTQDGIAYNVDARLRPEGSKGPLVSSVDAFRGYYLESAHYWEFQALLKARPIAGNRSTICRFMEMKKSVLMEKGRRVSVSDIRAMRERIRRELSREAEGYDVKLGPGGLEELEFAIQYLQLVNVHEHDEILVQGTLDAIKRLGRAGLLNPDEADFLRDAYLFYRTIETLMRLTGAPILREGSEGVRIVSEFMGFSKESAFLEDLKERRNKVREFFERLK